MLPNGWRVTCEQSEKIINELDELVETGFAGREVGRVEEMITTLSKTESDSDARAESLHRQIFGMEDDLGVGTVFWWELVKQIAHMADFAERVGNRLRLLIAT